MHFDVVSVTIEIAKYDQRDYYTKMRLEKERIDRTLGINTKFFQYLNGVPGSDFNWYVQITKIVADGQDDELGGTLGKHDIRIFKWWSKLLNSER
ncbi:MAG: hypothetical protein JWO82_1161 [Akkermansiaceae bacterium]|nr:hypothetical protein [Akkermansiaceae bacterium]